MQRYVYSMTLDMIGAQIQVSKENVHLLSRRFSDMSRIYLDSVDYQQIS